jgi:hypothetical protein
MGDFISSMRTIRLWGPPNHLREPERDEALSVFDRAFAKFMPGDFVTPAVRFPTGADAVWRSERLGRVSDSSSLEGSALAWPTYHRPPDEVEFRGAYLSARHNLGNLGEPLQARG